EREFEIHLARGGTDLKVDRVREVEPTLSLHDVGEQPDHVAILTVERELHVGLVVLKVFGAHRLIIPHPGREAATTGGARASVRGRGVRPRGTRSRTPCCRPSRTPDRSLPGRP